MLLAHRSVHPGLAHFGSEIGLPEVIHIPPEAWAFSWLSRSEPNPAPGNGVTKGCHHLPKISQKSFSLGSLLLKLGVFLSFLTVLGVSLMRFATLNLVGCLAVVFCCSALLNAQEAAPKKKAAEPAGRLPAYYKDVVDEAQRKKIYEIQAKYKVKIDVLAEEVKSLQSQRDKEIEALLSPEQKTKLAKVKAEADKKKAATADAIKANDATKTEGAKPAEGTKPAVPTSGAATTPAGATAVPVPATAPKPILK